MVARSSKTKDMERAVYVNYLERACECFYALQSSLLSEEWNAAAINAIHCTISAGDVMCVYFLAKRHSGEDHNAAVVLFQKIKDTEEFNTNANRISRVLRMKNMAEYEERLVYKS